MKRRLFAAILAMSLVISSLSPTAYAGDASSYTSSELESMQKYMNWITRQTWVGETYDIGTSFYASFPELEGNVTWSSSDESIATIDDAGVASFLSEGTVYFSLVLPTGETISNSLYGTRVKAVQTTQITVDGMDYTWYIPQTVKIGYCFCESIGESSYLTLVKASGFSQSQIGDYLDVVCKKLTSPATMECFTYPDASFVGGWVSSDKTATISYYIGYAIAPGTVSFQLMDDDTGTLLGEAYTVEVEEPVIETNAPSTATVGSSITLSAALTNTALEDELIADLEALVESDAYCNTHQLVYTPQFTIVEGADLVSTSNEDFTHTLTASEDLTFTGTGTVTIKVSYVPSILCYVGNYDNAELYTPETTITITVKEATTDLSACKATLSASSYTYDGTAKKPTVTIKNGSTTLTKGTDYTVTYSNNTDAGTATVTITGKGNYTGTITKTFTIAKATQSPTLSTSKKTVVAGSTGTVTVKSAKSGSTVTASSSDKKVATVSVNGKTIKIKGVKAGTATITVKVTNSNYKTVTKTITVTVKPSKTTGIKSTNIKTKKIKVSWTAQSGVTGYQIAYSTSKKFTSSTTKTVTVKGASAKTKTLSSLKNGKTYYVRVRAYKTINGKKVYGAWSTVKTVQVTK